MPTFEFTSPEGKTYEITGPEGATPDQAFKMLQQYHPDLGGSEQTSGEKSTNIAPETKDPYLGIHFGGSPVTSSTIAEGPTWEQAHKRLIDLENQGVSKDDPRYKQALKDKALGLQRLTGSAAEGFATLGAGAGGAKAAELAGKAIPQGAKDFASRLLPGATEKAQAAISDVGEASDKSALGSKMFRDLKTRMDNLLKSRSTTEKDLRAKYTSEGIQKEKDIASDYVAELQNLAAMRTHPVEQKLLHETATNLMKSRDLHSLVVEKRRLADIASSGEMSGYDAVQKSLARDLSQKLDEIITKHVPSYGEYTDKYASMSHDINLFEDTALGKRVTNEASDFLPNVPQFDPATLPKNAFSTKQSVKILRQLSGGNEKLVSDAASEHAATQLKDLSAPQARQWLNKNSEWLDEIPDVKKEVEKYVTNLEKVSHTQDKAKKALYGAAVAGGLDYGYHRLSNLVGM